MRGKTLSNLKKLSDFHFFFGENATNIGIETNWIHPSETLKNQDDLQTQLTEFGLATDAPERVGNRFTSLKKQWKPPLSSAPKTFRREETSSHQGRRNQDLIFNRILRSHGTEHVFMRKCPWTWILFSCESCRWNNKTVGTSWGVRRRTKGEMIGISVGAAAAASGVSSYGFFAPYGVPSYSAPRVIPCHVYSYMFV